MKRKDGRELVTEHPVTGADMVEYISKEEVDLSGSVLSCRMGGFRDDLMMDDDPSSGDFEDWGA